MAETGSNLGDGASELSVTVGVLTYPRPGFEAERFFAGLMPAIVAFPEPCEILVINNGDAAHRRAIGRAVRSSGIDDLASVRVLDSPANDIAIGRNLVLDSSRAPLVSFVDDDGEPTSDWLCELVRCLRDTPADVVAGPVLIRYAGPVTPWLERADLHEARGRLTGSSLPFVAAGGCLMRLSAADAERFDPAFGRTGGEDTEFFMRLADRGCRIVWCAEAVTLEHVPASRGTTHYALRRLRNQGATYRQVLRARGRSASGPVFVLRAAAMCLGSLPVAGALLLLRHRHAGKWLNRAASNFGKLAGPTVSIYAPATIPASERVQASAQEPDSNRPRSAR